MLSSRCRRRIRTAFIFWDKVVFFVLRRDIWRVTVLFSLHMVDSLVGESGVTPASNLLIFVSGTTLPPLMSHESSMPVRMTSKWCIPHILLKALGYVNQRSSVQDIISYNPLNISRKRFVSTRHVTEHARARTWEYRNGILEVQSRCPAFCENICSKG